MKSKQSKTASAHKRRLHGVVMPVVLILEHSNGGYSIECPKKLWGVQGPNKERVLQEAMHYFQQYASDGEYGHNDPS